MIPSFGKDFRAVVATLEMIGGKHKVAILFHLKDGARRSFCPEPRDLLLSNPCWKEPHSCKGCITDMHNPWIVKTFVPREGRLGALEFQKLRKKNLVTSTLS